ncbi:MAG: DUF2933 domain-containing protein [Pseudomonadota bacterium]
MDSHSHDHYHRKVGRWVFWGFALVAVYFLYTEHRAHLFSVLPFLLLAACPLMHLFHHHGGHRHGDSGDDDGGRERQRDQATDTAGQSHPNPHHH